MDSAQLTMRAPEMLARKNILLRTGVEVTQIDRTGQSLTLADGSSLSYTGLVLATGSSPRTLALQGMDASGVFVLRSRDDAQAIAQQMERCSEHKRELIVIGGGFIGLEVAATARKKGLSVTVLEAAPRLLGRVLAPVLSDWYAQLHLDHGVKLVLDARIDDLETGPDGAVFAVRMADGTRHPAGLVVVGVGVAANDQLAVTAGLAAILSGCARVVADVEMIGVGLSAPRLAHFCISTHQFISDADVIAQARTQGTTRAVQAMRKAHQLGLLDRAIVGIGNAPTALMEVVRLIREEAARPALVVGMPVGFVSAAESKDLMALQTDVPWVVIRGRKGGSTLVVAAIHALLGMAEAHELRQGLAA